ncbi:hypothetical protein HII08_004145 [Escherichia coli]|nr:hypothetical protein [Escherichia coli]
MTGRLDFFTINIMLSNGFILFLFIDRNLNPKKIKKTPRNGYFFDIPCTPYERKRLSNGEILIDTKHKWRFFAPFP